MDWRKIVKVKRGVKWILLFHLFAFLPFQISAQRLLTLDSCRQMALRYNKQMGVAKVKQDVAEKSWNRQGTSRLPVSCGTSFQIRFYNPSAKS